MARKDPATAPIDEETTTAEAPAGSSEGFEQPLGDPEILDAEDESSSVEGTAALGVKMMSIGCTMRWQSPLTTPEEEELHRDLAAVLRKYDAPDLPFVEELTLTANVGGIIFRRMAEEQMRAQKSIREEPAQSPPPPPKPSGVARDMSGVGKEGLGQNSGRPQASGARPGGEAGDLLS